MAHHSSAFFVLFVFFSFVGLISSTPVPNWPTNDMATRVVLGYNGFNGTPRKPQASAGGELGAVFYIADAVDLAKLFSNGADPKKNYICLITADAAKWELQPKVWVPKNVLDQGGATVNKAYPGSVIFAPHAHPGFPNAPAHVYQMGVRQAQIDRLDLQADCRAKDTFNNNHHTLDYKGLTQMWSIQIPKFTFTAMDVWQKVVSLLWY